VIIGIYIKREKGKEEEKILRMREGRRLGNGLLIQRRRKILSITYYLLPIIIIIIIIIIIVRITISSFRLPHPFYHYYAHYY